MVTTHQRRTSNFAPLPLPSRAVRYCSRTLSDPASMNSVSVVRNGWRVSKAWTYQSKAASGPRTPGSGQSREGTTSRSSSLSASQELRSRRSSASSARRTISTFSCDIARRLSRGSEHARQGRAPADLGLPRDLETVTLIERDRPGIRRLEERREMIRVDDLETSLHQLAAEPGPPVRRVDAKPREVPVRILRMAGVHLLQHPESVLQALRRHALLQDRNDRLSVGLNAGWDPPRHGRKPFQRPHRLVAERF